jgi:transposase
MGLVIEDDGWRVPDALWERIEPLLPKGKPHPWGVCRPRADERRLLNGILFVLRTGRHGDALNATGICKKSTAHDRYRDGKKAGVFAKLWAAALQEYDALKGSIGNGWRWTER